MAIRGIDLYPTCDVHLLRDPSTPMVLKVREWLELPLLPHASISHSDFSSTLVDVSVSAAGVEFKPKATVGSTVGRIKFNDATASPAVDHELLVRVFVHQKIDSFWLGNNRFTIHKGESNYVLTVLAKFDDGVIGDVSSHPYLTYSSSSANLTVDAFGRLKGVNQTASVTVTVSHTNVAGTVSKQVTGKVREPVDTARPILKRIFGTGNYKKRRNILFVAEGFTSSQQALFNSVAQKIAHNLLNTPTHSPFNLLRGSFNVWTAFEPSAESGVTIESPVTATGKPIPRGKGDPCNPGRTTFTFKQLVSIVGLPDAASPTTLAAARTKWTADFPGTFSSSKLDKKGFDEWKAQRADGIPQARDALFGFALGLRFGDRRSSTKTLPLNRWFITSGPPRQVAMDRRRIDEEGWAQPFLIKYLRSLKFGPSSDPDHDVSEVWDFDAKDRRLVCFLVNDHYWAGMNFGQFAMTIGAKKTHPTTKAGTVIDHTPSITLPDVEIPLSTALMAHEFAHSFALLDEYEGYDDPSRTELLDTDTGNKKRIDGAVNLTHFFRIKDAAGTKIDPSKIKWNWHRIQRASALAKKAVASSGKIKVELAPGEAATWTTEQSANTTVYLRHPELNPHANGSKAKLSAALKIDAITGNALTLSGDTLSTPDDYPAGSALFAPKLSGATELKLIDASVLSHLAVTGKPFGAKSTCAVCSADIAYPDAGILAFKYPRFRYQLIGLYEGGGTFNCKVYRPTGVSRMRKARARLDIDEFYYDPNVDLMVWDFEKQRQHNFSFVSQYVLVQAIDPGMFALLDANYPK